MWNEFLFASMFLGNPQLFINVINNPAAALRHPLRQTDEIHLSVRPKHFTLTADTTNVAVGNRVGLIFSANDVHYFDNAGVRL